MLPTLKPGQDVLVLCWFYTLKRGDLVAFKKDGKEMVKRVQKVLLGDEPTSNREIIVQGDNKEQSADSRKFGPVDKSQIIGKVIWYQR